MNPSFLARSRHARLRLASLIFTVTAAPLAASATIPMQRQQVEALVPQIESYVKETMQTSQVPGVALGIVANDELVYAKGYGVRETGSSDPVNADTLFQIGSTTKAFLGATQALLVDQGKLAWNDKVIDHYPEFRLADPWVTQEFVIADLLAQRSGLPYSTLTNMMLYDYSRTDIIRALRFVEPVSSFRSTFAYQNAFHIVAGKIVAQHGNTGNWEAFLQTQLLDPLGMTSSSYTAQAIEQSTNRASGHRREGENVVVDPWAPFPYNAGGAGNLNSSINDMSRWLRFQINQGEIDGKRIVSTQAIAETHQPRIVVANFMRDLMKHGPDDEMSYATGWIVHATPQGRIIEHGGGTTGYTSHVAFDPDRRVGVVILTNLSADIGSGVALPIGKYVTDLLQGRPATDYATPMLAMMRDHQARTATELKPPANARSPRPLNDYSGVYTSPTLGRVELAVENGKLAFTLGPRKVPVMLEPWSGDVFIAHAMLPAFGPNPFHEQKKLTFHTDGDDNIVGFDWTDESDGSGQPPFVRDEAK